MKLVEEHLLKTSQLEDLGVVPDVQLVERLVAENDLLLLTHISGEINQTPFHGYGVGLLDRSSGISRG